MTDDPTLAQMIAHDAQAGLPGMSRIDAPVEAELVAGRIVIKSGFRDKDLIKMVPGARWDTEGKVWYTPLSWTACHALRGIFQSRLQIGYALTEWAQGELNRWMREALELRYATDHEGDAQEYPFQRVGSYWLRLVQYGLLTDEMGVGKTVQGAVALRDLHAAGHLRGPVLIVCPNSVKTVWKEHLAHWAPALRVEVVSGGAAARRKILDRLHPATDLELNAKKPVRRPGDELDVVIVNWEALRLHSRLAPYGSIRLSEKEKQQGELNIQWGAVVADEAHRAKSPSAKQTRALWAASAHADYRWALTGTPIAKTPDDLWALLHFILPEEWPSKSKFIDRYCMQSWNPFGGLQVVGLHPATEPELRKTLDARMLRRLKAEVLPQLPAKIYQQRTVTLTPKEQKAYDKMEEELLLELESGEQVVGWNPLTKMTRLLQLASASLCPAEEQSEGEQQFRICEPSSKLDELMELLNDLGDEPVVVAAVSRQLIELAERRLDKAGITYGSVHGNVTPEVRRDNVEAFQEGRLRVMLLTVAAGGEGITLHRANTIIFLQRPWSMIQNKQAEDRIHRIGQEADHVFVIDLLTTGTAEEGVTLALLEKEENLEEVVRDRDRLRRMLGGS